MSGKQSTRVHISDIRNDFQQQIKKNTRFYQCGFFVNVNQSLGVHHRNAEINLVRGYQMGTDFLNLSLARTLLVDNAILLNVPFLT